MPKEEATPQRLTRQLNSPLWGAALPGGEGWSMALPFWERRSPERQAERAGRTEAGYSRDPNPAGRRQPR